MRIVAIDIGIRNLAICTADWSQVVGESYEETFREHMQIITWTTLDLTAELEAYKFNRITADRDIIYRQFAINVRRQLSTIDWTDIDLVLIEDQAKFNEMTKIIQAYVQAFFVYDQPATTMRIVSSRNKTTIVRRYLESRSHRIESVAKKNHAKNKKEVVWMCDQLLTDDGQWTTLFRQSKKKDDLADTLIHIIGYISQHDWSNDPVF
jgi:hypothetical protein